MRRKLSLDGREALVDNNKNDEGPLNELGSTTLTTAQVLEEIGSTVRKEKTRREKIKKENEKEVFKLTQDMLVVNGDLSVKTTMPKDLATLKSLIKIIVRDELRKNQID